MMHCLVGNSSERLDEFDELHVHMPRLVDLIHVGLHRKVEEWAYLTSSKVIVADA